MPVTKRSTTLTRTIQVSAPAGALGAAAPNPIFQGQEVQFSVTWPPSPPLSQVPGTITDAWTITPAPQTPTSYVYHNVERLMDASGNFAGDFVWDTSEVEPGTYDVSVTLSDGVNSETLPTTKSTDVLTPSQVTVKLRPIASGDVIPVTMTRASEPPTSDAALWVAIRYSANQLSFPNFVKFADTIMCNSTGGTIDNVIDGYLNGNGCLPPLAQRRFTPFPNMDAYRVLKIATECFMMLNCGVYLEPDMLSRLVNNQVTASNPPVPGVPFPPPVFDVSDDAARLNQSITSLPEQITNWWSVYLQSANQNLNSHDPQSLIIPYLALVRSRLKDLPLTTVCQMGMECYGILQRKLTNPCLIELIWSYWHEEAMLVQTLNAISRRFQNLRGPTDRDPLTRFDIDPLRRLNSFLWGYVQDEQHRLTVVRRAYEYSHEYGLALEGRSPCGSRALISIPRQFEWRNCAAVRVKTKGMNHAFLDDDADPGSAASSRRLLRRYPTNRGHPPARRSRARQRRDGRPRRRDPGSCSRSRPRDRGRDLTDGSAYRGRWRGCCLPGVGNPVEQPQTQSKARRKNPRLPHYHRFSQARNHTG